jgi:hypothetical protein
MAVRKTTRAKSSSSSASVPVRVGSGVGDVAGSRAAPKLLPRAVMLHVRAGRVLASR